VLVEVMHEGTTVCVCYPLPNAHTDRMTLGDYRARFGETYRRRERWYLMNGAVPVEDRMAERR
jgi:hypothetical protein